MIKRLVLTAAFMFVPAAAMAQDHSAHHPPAKAAGVAEHKDFAQQLIEKRADLKLTDAQVTKLTALSAKMGDHHKEMGKNAEHDIEMEEKMHAQLRAVFTPEQMEKVHALMTKHAAEMCGGNGKDDKCHMKMRE